MDYNDFSQVLTDMADKIAAKLKAEAPAQGAEDSSLLTAKEVRAIIGVTDKTLHV